MQVESAKAELRSRSPFEAADLGLLLLRSLWRPSFWAWCGFVLPVQLLVLFLCRSAPAGLSFLVLWWLKPLYDRAFGLVVGRGLFGDAPGLRALYRGLWHDGRRGLLADLLWRRFDPARSWLLPINLLEGLRGKAAAKRRRNITQGSTNAVLQLLMASLLLELATAAGLFAGAMLLLPDQAQFIAEDTLSWSWDEVMAQIAGASYALAMGLVEPVFVAAGFGSYVNRRTDLEGWDVELTFRRMARRLAPALLAALCFATSPGHAEDGGVALSEPIASLSALDGEHRLPAPVLDESGEAERSMDRVLARPELQRAQVEETWELRSQAKADRSEPSAGWISALVTAIARGAELAAWLFAMIALVVLIYLTVERTRRQRWPARPERVAPERAAVVRALDLPARELPLSEVVPTALGHFASGREAAALSTLYIGTLNALKAQDRLELPARATEAQCLAAVQAAPIAEAHRKLFGELTVLWQLSAYAHARIAEPKLSTLCAQFRACFEPGARS